MPLPHLLLQIALAGSVPAKTPWRTLVVGGGPVPSRNQVAIEGNVRYLERILDPSAPRHVLFADGQARTASVVFLGQDGRRLRYRAPRLARLDGPSTPAGVDAAFRGFVAVRPRDPLLLYFTGHGIPNPRGDLANNAFETWGEGTLTVQQLARQLEALPRETPVALVMAQCFSGSFANVLFERGRPDGAAVDRNLAGFFASTDDRPATGCTPEVNEEEYRDFTSYFFAALSGRTRLGKAVGGADYDGNGWVGMDEAFAYSLVHQVTEDVPVSTSDAFLRRFVDKPDPETMATPYRTILAWSSPAQRAALEGLSARLRLTGEDRLRVAYDAQFGPGRRSSDETTRAHRLRFIRAAKSVVLARTLIAVGDPSVVARFQRLRAAEAGNPLLGIHVAPPALDAADKDDPYDEAAVDPLPVRRLPRGTAALAGAR